MPDQILVLDGSMSGGPDLGKARSLLLEALERRGAEVHTVLLEEEVILQPTVSSQPTADSGDFINAT